MTSQTHQRLSLALELWTQIANINPEAKSFRMSEYALRQSFEEIQEAIDLDASGITATFLLRHLINQYLDERSFTLKELIHSPSEVQAALAKPKQLLELLNHPQTQSLGQEFISGLKQALRRYKAIEREDVQKALEDEDLIAILRRDALKSLQKLEVHQFLSGKAESEDSKPAYNEFVHQWWNMNSLLSASVQMPSGVSMNMIRDPDAFQSYFCFAIRNGANLFILTDIEKLQHPLQGGMRRRGDRVMENRAQRHWFPYDLLDLEYDEQAKRLYESETSERSLVQHQTSFRPLQRIESLEARSLIWTSMMFDLIVEKFWHQKFQCQELSFTAEMIQVRDGLLETAKNANLPAVAQRALEMEPLKTQDIHTENIDAQATGAQPTKENFWLEQKFRDQVNPDTLNLLASPDKKFLLSSDTGSISESSSDEENSQWLAEKVDRKTSLAHLNSTQFGTQKQLEQDRLFIARHNLAAQINKLAANDFEARKKEVLSWYLKQVRSNLEHILQWCGHEEIWGEYGQEGTFDNWRGHVSQIRSVPIQNQENLDSHNRKRQAFHAFIYTHELKSMEWQRRVNLLSANRMSPLGEKQELLCQITGAKSSYVKVIAPVKAAEIAMLCNCAVKELPQELQHWDLRQKYIGNSILDRIDPMEWVLKNPWHKLDLRLLFCLSKRGIKQISLRANKPPLHWLNTEKP